MSSDTRRRAAENAFRRAREAGHPVEQDAEFMALIEEWIAEKLEMSQVAQCYRTVVTERSASRRLKRTVTSAGNAEKFQVFEVGKQPDLESEIDQLIEIELSQSATTKNGSIYK